MQGGGRMLRTYGRRRGDVFESDPMWIAASHHLFEFSPEISNSDMEEEGSDGRRGVFEELNCGDLNGTAGKKHTRQRKAKDSALLKLKACFEEESSVNHPKTPKLPGGGSKAKDSPWVADGAMDVASEEKTIVRRKRFAAKETSRFTYAEDDNKQLKATLASSRKNGNDDKFRKGIRLTFSDDSLYSTEETSDVSVSGGQGSESSMPLQENPQKDARKLGSPVGEMRGSDTGHDVASADGNASFLLESACNKSPFNRFVTVTRKQKISTLSDFEDLFNAEASTGSVESMSKQLAVFASTPKRRCSISNLGFSTVNVANKQMRLRNCKVSLEDLVLHDDIHSFLQKNRVRVSSKILHKLKRNGHLNGSLVQVCTSCLAAGHLAAMDKIASAGNGVAIDLSASVCSDKAEGLLVDSDSSHHMDHDNTIMTATLVASRTETSEVQHDRSSLCDNSSQSCIGQTPKLANNLEKDDPPRTETSEVQHDRSSLCDNSSQSCIGQTPKLANNLEKDDPPRTETSEVQHDRSSLCDNSSQSCIGQTPKLANNLEKDDPPRTETSEVQHDGSSLCDNSSQSCVGQTPKLANNLENDDPPRTETSEVQHDGSLCDNSSLLYIGQTPTLANNFRNDDPSATLDTSRMETSEVQHDGSLCDNSSLLYIGQTPTLANNFRKDDPSARLDTSRMETSEVQHDGSLCDNSSLPYIGQTPTLANNFSKDDPSATPDTSRTETSEVQHDGSFLCDSTLSYIGQTPKLANNGKKWSRMKSVLGRRNSVLFTPESPPNKHAALVRRSEFSTSIPLPSLVTTCATDSPNTEASAQGLQLVDMDDNSGAYNAFLSPMIYDDSIQDTEAGLAEENIYRECKQMGPLAFSQWLLSVERGSCVKVGEGVYGEVFRMCNGRDEVSVFKVVPIEGSALVNEESQKSFKEILPEIMISKQLSNLHEGDRNQSENFIKLNSLRCLQGSYPDRLLEAWNEFHENKISDNDCPDFFTDSQLFIVFEFEEGGTSLETYQFSSMLQMLAVLQQVLVALAVAEEAICFEHRDLHWGNVLVKQTKKKKLSYRLFGQTFSMPTHGVQAKIIDYTLSRMEHEGIKKFSDMASDEMLFQGQGDYQYDIYRMMRNENNNNWAAYSPHTNVLWLHYLAGKMLHGVNCRQRRQVSPRKRLERFARDALAFPSATELVRSGPSLLVSPHPLPTPS
ncbi:serine/threonine-protein kinase haspin isoform X2 [Lethenteron reissneri]|uniref:serine/threonine-protein kinase haspin isoform X2 n=1 Tax=Lethenteron reissneri TaxID=7753 RepID=UPI002AB64B36|nr:serine/threonine-protein kinase haspin isoform X2 [Lethenteron reissneri]